MLAAEQPQAHGQPQALQLVEQELAQARAELATLHELLKDIPEIFERKFNQRLQPLLAENRNLRQQLLAPKQLALLQPRQTSGLADLELSDLNDDELLPKAG
ncbi:hypothetical protein KBY58_01645 [Cyanobium sp. HWJ4-Hawea]|uniref:hypothetical protein n=1 Tax=Cyanobium sp. HWJ4-Hawea TaxID=2823713 RepID=UPI0020CC513E|nr:hypothetical protein [Cyanobium sp. HWJ4-Hawea]MCP9808136.1 hypothetical protein [Cyanobium sp. HWJ4-Hawea]